MISVLSRLAFVFCLTTVPAWAQLNFSFNDVSPTSLSYNGREYADSTRGGGISANNGIPWINTYTRPDNSTYQSSFFSCSGISLRISGQTVNGTCAAWTFHFSYTYSQPDANTLKIAYTLYNDSTTDTMTSVIIPLAGIILPHPYTNSQNGVGNPVPVAGFVHDFLSWSAAESDAFTDDTSGWLVNTLTTANTPDSSHDELDFIFKNQQESGNCGEATTVPDALCQIYSAPIAPSSSHTANFYLRFAPTSASRASLVPEVISAWNTAFPSVVNWSDRRPIGQLFVAAGATSSTNPGGYFSDPTCNCTNQATFHNRLQAYITQTLNTVNSFGFPIQGFILWDLEGEESGSLNYVGDPRSLPTVSPQMDAEADAMFAQLTALGYRVGMMLRANTFHYGSSLPSTPCTYNTPFASSDTSDNSAFQPPFFLSTGTPGSRVYGCSQSTLTWALGGYQSSWEQQSQAAADIISKATYAYNRWGATLFYVDSNGWYGDGQYAPQIWKQIQAAVPNALFIPEHANAVQFPYISAYNDAGFGGAYNSAEAGYQIPYPNAFFVSFNNGTSMTHVAEIAAGMCHGDIYGLQAWWNSGEAPVLAAAMTNRKCGVAPPAPTGLTATIE